MFGLGRVWVVVRVRVRVGVRVRVKVRVRVRVRVRVSWPSDTASCCLTKSKLERRNLASSEPGATAAITWLGLAEG